MNETDNKAKSIVKTFRVNIIGVVPFWITSTCSDDLIAAAESLFNEEQKTRKIKFLKGSGQKARRTKFIKEAKQYIPDIEIVYRTPFERELKKRERSAKWAWRFLVESGGHKDLTYETVAKWQKGETIPKIEYQHLLEDHLGFSFYG